MADIGVVLRRTIDGFSRNNPQIREKVYEKARSAVERQIQSASPPMSPLLAAARRTDMEEAISSTEHHYQALESAQADLVEPLEEEAPPEKIAVQPESTPPSPVMRRKPAPSPIEPRRTEPAFEPMGDLDPLPAAVVRQPQRPMPDMEKPFLRTRVSPRETMLEPVPGFGRDPEPETQPEQISPTLRRPELRKTENRKPSERRLAPMAVVLPQPPAEPEPMPVVEPTEVPTSHSRPKWPLAAAALGTAATAIACAAIVFYSSGSQDSPKDPVPVVAETPNRVAPPQTAWDDGNPDTPAPNKPIVNDGVYVPKTPAPSPSVSVPPVVPIPTPTAPAVPTTPEIQTPPPTIVAPDPAPVSGPARSVFYEEKTLSQEGTMIAGETSWSVVEEAPQEGAAPEPVIRGVVAVPGRDTKLTLTLRRNDDATLPASHLVEMTFETSPDIVVEEARQVFLKPSEKDKGQPLIGISGRVSDGYFILALNNLDEAKVANETLLKTRSWIDIPVAYQGGRRALFSLEKGATGNEAFTKAFEAWDKLPPG
jgi:hypothetical protein